MLHQAFEEIDEKLPKTLKEGYEKKVNTFNENLHDILRRGFGMTRDEVFQFLCNNESSGRDYTIKELKSVFANEAASSLIRQFNKKFKKDESEKLRDWPKIEEAEIQSLHKECKESVEKLFDTFRKIIFPSNITKMEELPGDPNASNTSAAPTMENLISEEVNFDAKRLQRMSTISISSIRLLTENEIGRVKTKFQEEVDQALAEAIRLHVSFPIHVLICFDYVEKHWNIRGATVALGSTCLVRIRQRVRIPHEPNHILPSHIDRGCLRDSPLVGHPQNADRTGLTPGESNCQSRTNQSRRPVQTLRTASLQQNSP